MSKTDEIKFHSNQKQKYIKTSRTAKTIGILSCCAGIATLIACILSEKNDNLTTSSTLEMLLGVLCLNISREAQKRILFHQQQIRKIKKQK